MGPRLEDYGLASCPACRCLVAHRELPSGRVVWDPCHLDRRTIRSLVGSAVVGGWGQVWGLISKGPHECPPEDLERVARRRHDVRRN